MLRRRCGSACVRNFSARPAGSSDRPIHLSCHSTFHFVSHSFPGHFTCLSRSRRASLNHNLPTRSLTSPPLDGQPYCSSERIRKSATSPLSGKSRSLFGLECSTHLSICLEDPFCDRPSPRYLLQETCFKLVVVLVLFIKSS